MDIQISAFNRRFLIAYGKLEDDDDITVVHNLDGDFEIAPADDDCIEDRGFGFSG